MNIRSAGRNDCLSLAQLNRAVQNPHARAVPQLFKLDPDPTDVAEFFRQLLEDPDNHILILEDEGVDLGYLYCQILRRNENAFMFPYHVVYIHHIAVKEGYQGIGSGRRLIEAALDLAQEQDISQVALDVWSFNENAQAFFSHMGFQTFNLRMNVWLSDNDMDPQKASNQP